MEAIILFLTYFFLGIIKSLQWAVIVSGHILTLFMLILFIGIVVFVISIPGIIIFWVVENKFWRATIVAAVYSTVLFLGHQDYLEGDLKHLEINPPLSMFQKTE